MESQVISPGPGQAVIAVGDHHGGWRSHHDFLSLQMREGFTATALASTNLALQACRDTAALALQQEKCCCEIKAQIAKCCCDLQAQIIADGTATRNLITANTIQSLRDQIAVLAAATPAAAAAAGVGVA